MRFLAHSVEVELAHEMAETGVILAAGRLHLEPRRLPLRKRLRAVTPHDLVECIGHRECEDTRDGVVPVASGDLTDSVSANGCEM
jgi:hypothetical protein